MKTLGIDIETFSSADLKKTGVYKYSVSTDFEILLFGYSVDGGDVQVVDFTAGEKLPGEIAQALTDPGVTNASAYPVGWDFPRKNISTQGSGAAPWFGRPIWDCPSHWKVSVRCWGWRSKS